MTTTNQHYIDVPTKTIRTADGNTVAYRETGIQTGTPIIALNHLSGNLDNWDPAVIDGLAQNHWIITFDYLGVGASSGHVSSTIQGMAAETLAFIQALQLTKVDLLGFSMGGMVAQELLALAPQLVRRAILTGTGPRGGQGIENVTHLSDRLLVRSLLSFTDVKTFLFFTRTANGKRSAREFLQRIKARHQHRDRQINWFSYRRQLKAIVSWGRSAPADFSKLKLPILIANGDHDIMVPTEPNSYDLHQRINNSQLIIYPDAGHAGIFQYHAEFVSAVNDFLV